MDEQLARSSMRQSDLAKRTGVSPAYVNRLMTGKAKASPQWVDLVSRTLDLPRLEEEKLHIAAARDAGYKIGPEQEDETDG
jgi:transcriptional regulator with XRE-family HTH domain